MKGLMTGMNEVSDKPSFDLLPEGQYIVEVDAVEDGASKSGDPMMKVKLKVVQGEFKNRFIWDYIIISGNPESKGWNIRWRAKMFLKAIGEPHHGDSFEWDSDRWPYRKCAVEVTHDTQKEGKYAGQKQARVKSYLPIDADTKNGTEDEDVPF